MRTCVYACVREMCESVRACVCGIDGKRLHPDGPNRDTLQRGTVAPWHRDTVTRYTPGSASPRIGGRAVIRCTGAGSGGVDEMRAHLNEKTVMWGLLRFTIGSGR
jgi:hypothetical protein